MSSARLLAPTAGLAAIWSAMLLGGGGTADRALYEALYAGHRPVLLAIARGLTMFGEPTTLIIAGFVLAGWLWWKGRRRLVVALILVILLGRALSEVQKYGFARLRPNLEPHLVVVKSNSFPSGHATASMIFYLSLALALTAHNRWRVAVVAGAILLSLFIGTSRVMLGVHWPSDVVGGWAFGLLWVLLTLRPTERLLRTDSEKVRTAL